MGKRDISNKHTAQRAVSGGVRVWEQAKCSERRRLRLWVKRRSRTARHIVWTMLAAAVWLAGCGEATPPGRRPADDGVGSDKLERTAPERGDILSRTEPSESRQTPEQPEPPVADTRVYRPSDSRPVYDDAQLADVGIHTYESKRLKLYTDIAPELAEPLPGVMDQAYDAWVDYFGPMPPDREGTEYRMTGFIMADRDLFERHGLVPDELPESFHGRHQRAQFWMADQKYDYYRRHLMIHEGTHCFMLVLPETRAPVWYLEGMAELFGTHRIGPEGRVEFRIMPRDRNEPAGVHLDRLKLIREEVAEQGYRSVAEISQLQPGDFVQNESYAWSWAVCKFFDTHPGYRDRFRELGRQQMGDQFDIAIRQLFDHETDAIRTEWSLFATNLCHGYDIERAAITFRPGSPLRDDDGARHVEIAADRGWQSSEVLVHQGDTYQVTATGQFTLAQEPKPWVSEANGISFQYSDGRPLGMLLATIRTASPAEEGRNDCLLQVIPMGAHAQLTAPLDGTLYFRVNDFWYGLFDNTGKVSIAISTLSDPSPP